MANLAGAFIVALLVLATAGCLSESGSRNPGRPQNGEKASIDEIKLTLAAAPLGNVASLGFTASVPPAVNDAALSGRVSLDYRFPFEVTVFREDNQSYSRIALLYAFGPSGSANVPPAGTTRPYLSDFDWKTVDQPLSIPIGASGSFILAFGYKSRTAIELSLKPSNSTIHHWTSYTDSGDFFFLSNDDGPTEAGEFSANAGDKIYPARFSGSKDLNVSGAATIFWGGGPSAGGTFKIALAGPVAKTWTVSNPGPGNPLLYNAEIHSVTLPRGDWRLSYEALWGHGVMLISVLNVPEGPPMVFSDELCQPRLPCHTGPA